MKKCVECLEVKGLEEFYDNKRSKDGKNYTCKVCCRKRDKQKYLKRKEEGKIAKYREDNKDKIQSYNIEYQKAYRSSDRKRERKLAMTEYKGGKCNLCGIIANKVNLAAFDFHHKDPDSKEYTPSDMVNMRWERITLELDKCVLLCSNCHRVLHSDNTVESLLDEESVTTIETMYEIDTEGSRVGYKLLVSEAGGS